MQFETPQMTVKDIGYRSGDLMYVWSWVIVAGKDVARGGAACWKGPKNA